MAKVIKCINKDCPVKKQCGRYVAKPTKEMKTCGFVGMQIIDGRCFRYLCPNFYRKEKCNAKTT